MKIIWLSRQTVPTMHNPVTEKKYLRTPNRDCGTNSLLNECRIKLSVFRKYTTKTSSTLVWSCVLQGRVFSTAVIP